jgi:hypothetical protein
MIRSILNYIKVETAKWMSDHNPDYLLVKQKSRSVTSSKHLVFCNRINDKHSAWILIGGESSSSFLWALIYWTTEGDSIEDLDNISTSEIIDSKGCMQLTDEQLVGDDLPWDGARLLGL